MIYKQRGRVKMKYDDWYFNLPLYKKENMQNEMNFIDWERLSESQKHSVYQQKSSDLYIDGPVEFYREEEWMK